MLNLPATRDLIDRLHADETLRQLCGLSSAAVLPHESEFSRAFAEFAETELPQQLHAEVIAATQQQRIIVHIARAHRAGFHCHPGAGAFSRNGETEGGKEKIPEGQNARLPGVPEERLAWCFRSGQSHQKLDRMLAPHPRRGTKKPSRIPKVFPDKPTPQLTWAHDVGTEG